MRAQTAVGQAHWAGTGPVSCAKYRDMMGHAPTFDAQRASCRFFIAGDGPPKKEA